MTPEELRALAEAATLDPRWWEGDEHVRPGFEQLEAGNTLVRLASDLALLCAEMGEVLQNVVSVAWLDKATDEQNEALRQRADAVEAVLAKLAELETP